MVTTDNPKPDYQFSVGDRLAVVGVVLALLAIAGPYLWPDKKWIGWFCLILTIVVVFLWACFDFRRYSARIKIAVVVCVAAIAGSVWLSTKSLNPAAATDTKTASAGPPDSASQPVVKRSVDAGGTNASKSYSGIEKKISKKSAPKSSVSLPTNTAIDKQKTRNELANLLRQYYQITKGDCIPNMIGPPGSGAAHTPQECEQKLKDWRTKATTAIQGMFDRGELDWADVAPFGWNISDSELAESIKRLIDVLRK